MQNSGGVDLAPLNRQSEQKNKSRKARTKIVLRSAFGAFKKSLNCLAIRLSAVRSLRPHNVAVQWAGVVKTPRNLMPHQSAVIAPLLLSLLSEVIHSLRTPAQSEACTVATATNITGPVTDCRNGTRTGTVRPNGLLNRRFIRAYRFSSHFRGRFALHSMLEIQIQI